MNYFEGYYVKCGGIDGSVAFIFGKQVSGQEKSSFIQIITEEDSYFTGFDYADFFKSKRGFNIKINDNHADKSGMVININQPGLRASGEVKFGSFGKIKYDAMGPFKILPFMECRHSVISMRHTLSGMITINNKIYNFYGGLGYIEGDRGKSFPKKYFWTQSNSFIFTPGSEVKTPAVFISAAAIPYLGLKFTGTVSVIHCGGREYRLATYLGAKVKNFTSNKLVISQGFGKHRKIFEAEKLNTDTAEFSRELLAPSLGAMSRTISESLRTNMRYKFTVGGRVFFEFVNPHAAYEFSENN